MEALYRYRNFGLVKSYPVGRMEGIEIIMNEYL